MCCRYTVGLILVLFSLPQNVLSWHLSLANLGQYISSPGNRSQCYAELAISSPMVSSDFHPWTDCVLIKGKRSALIAPYASSLTPCVTDRACAQPRPQAKRMITDVGLQPYVAIVCGFNGLCPVIHVNTYLEQWVCVVRLVSGPKDKIDTVTGHLKLM